MAPAQWGCLSPPQWSQLLLWLPLLDLQPAGCWLLAQQPSPALLLERRRQQPGELPLLCHELAVPPTPQHEAGLAVLLEVKLAALVLQLFLLVLLLLWMLNQCGQASAGLPGQRLRQLWQLARHHLNHCH